MAAPLPLQALTFIPAGTPWQKTDRVVSAAEHRWEMTRLAVAGVAYFEADDREIRRDGLTYTIDTVEELGEDELFLIVGSDAAAGLPTWRRHRELLDRVQVAVFPRPGWGYAAVSEALREDFEWLDGPELDISATGLRARVAAGRSIRFLVPEAVREYIDDHHLYGAESTSP